MMGCKEDLNLRVDPFQRSIHKLRPLLPNPNHHYVSHHHILTNPLHHHHCDFGHRYSKGEAEGMVSSRWNPTAEQLMALEELYRSGTRTPSADQIQDITAQLRRYGKIEGKNVFYWFQNHKARERQKRRRQLLHVNNNSNQPGPGSCKDDDAIGSKDKGNEEEEEEEEEEEKSYKRPPFRIISHTNCNKEQEEEEEVDAAIQTADIPPRRAALVSTDQHPHYIPTNLVLSSPPTNVQQLNILPLHHSSLTTNTLPLFSTSPPNVVHQGAAPPLSLTLQLFPLPHHLDDAAAAATIKDTIPHFNINDEHQNNIGFLVSDHHLHEFVPYYHFI